MSEPVPKCRWFRYSLRTLFVVVAVLGCWLGYQANWIRARHELLASKRFHAASFIVTRAPGALPLFGEQGVAAVEARPGVSEADIERFRERFPETVVIPVYLSP